jgi:predicted CopG family antitoxin
LSRYASISVLREVKELLEREKGNKDWSNFLLELYMEAKSSKSRSAFEKLRRLLTEEDLNNIEKSSKEFREGFELR